MKNITLCLSLLVSSFVFSNCNLVIEDFDGRFKIPSAIKTMLKNEMGYKIVKDVKKADYYLVFFTNGKESENYDMSGELFNGENLKSLVKDYTARNIQNDHKGLEEVVTKLGPCPSKDIE